MRLCIGEVIGLHDYETKGYFWFDLRRNFALSNITDHEPVGADKDVWNDCSCGNGKKTLARLYVSHIDDQEGFNWVAEVCFDCKAIIKNRLPWCEVERRDFPDSSTRQYEICGPRTGRPVKK